MAKRKTKKKKSNAPVIAAGLLGVGLVGTLVDKMNVFGNNPDGKWWWERIYTPPIGEKAWKTCATHKLYCAECEKIMVMDL